MSAVLLTDSWIETEGCDGPRAIRKQTSREEGGVLMSDIQNKYIPEFELPYRNIERYIKEISNNWDRLDEKQRAMARKSFQNMGMDMNMDPVGQKKEGFGTLTDPVTVITDYLATDTKKNPKNLLNAIYNPTDAQVTQMSTAGVTSKSLKEIKESIYDWSVDNTYCLHSNWKSGLILSFLLLLIFILIIVAATSSNGGNSIGR
jgi:hypothetical protein